MEESAHNVYRDDDNGKGVVTREKQLRRILHRIRRRPLPAVLGCGACVFAFGFGGLWTFRHLQCFSREAGVHWKPAPILNIQRSCPSVDSMYTTVVAAAEQKPHICLTTLTDRQSQSIWQRMLRCRDFDGVAKLTFPNLQAYANRHGYTLRDASDIIDTSRPPAWSKIKAVQSMLQSSNECDWVFWVDADIVVMNSTIAIESFLPATDTNIDLIITMDRRFTANSGAWLIRNTAWSRGILQTWWNMRRWVREPGLSLSGDNAAFGHLMEQRLLDKEHSTRIRMIPRCTFNSFAVFVPEGSSGQEDQQQELFMSDNFYHQGDFMAHASGVDQKEACVSMLLAKAT